MMDNQSLAVNKINMDIINNNVNIIKFIGLVEWDMYKIENDNTLMVTIRTVIIKIRLIVELWGFRGSWRELEVDHAQVKYLSGSTHIKLVRDNIIVILFLCSS